MGESMISPPYVGSQGESIPQPSLTTWELKDPVVRVIGLAVMDFVRKMLIWIAIAAVVILAILLPVIVVTGMFGGKPLAGTVALIGLVLLAFGVAWYVRSRGEEI
jgi:hypothetical protein